MKSPHLAVTRTTWTVVAVGIIVMGCLLLMDMISFENLSLTTSTTGTKRNVSLDSLYQQIECVHNDVDQSAFILDVTENIISKKDFDFCSQIENNVVHQRDFLRRKFASFENNRPFSLTKKTITTFHGTNRTCDSLDDMLSAIQFGSRRWDNPALENATSLEKEVHQSYFVPHKCDVPPMSSFEMCDTLSRYQHVVNIGDSLSRHVHQGLFIGLRHDYISGGIQTTNLPTYELCKCDGQFSEHSTCRKNGGLFSKLESSRQLGICSQQKPFSMSFLESVDLVHLENEIPWNEIECNSSDYRGLLLVIGGGVHFGLDFKAIISGSKHFFERQQLQNCVDRGKAHVVWTGFGSQSRSLDTKYPHQSREQAVVFNQGMSDYFSSIKMNVTELHFWNLTKDAQSSDGLHLPSGVNAVKAFFLLRVANLLKEESAGGS
jgi:hypothetical protein